MEFTKEELEAYLKVKDKLKDNEDTSNIKTTRQKDWNEIKKKSLEIIKSRLDGVRISTICEWVGVSNGGTNRQKLKKILDNLPNVLRVGKKYMYSENLKKEEPKQNKVIRIFAGNHLEIYHIFKQALNSIKLVPHEKRL